MLTLESCLSGGQRTACRSWLSPPTKWVPRSLGLVAITEPITASLCYRLSLCSTLVKRQLLQNVHRKHLTGRQITCSFRASVHYHSGELHKVAGGHGPGEVLYILICKQQAKTLGLAWALGPISSRRDTPPHPSQQFTNRKPQTQEHEPWGSVLIHTSKLLL